MEKDLEVGEPAQKEVVTEQTQQVQKPERKKKELSTISIYSPSILVPPAGVMAGTGNKEAKYKAWLEKETNVSVSMFNQLNVQHAIGQTGRKRFGFLQTMCYLAVVEEESEAVTYVFHGDRSKLHFNLIDTLHQFVIENQAVLSAIAPYLKIDRNEINPQT